MAATSSSRGPSPSPCASASPQRSWRRGAAEGGVQAAEADAVAEIRAPYWRVARGFVASLALTILGACVVVHGAVPLAADLGLSEAMIGLTIVAIGTSLPVPAASVPAALEGEAVVAFGNIIGSNIFNVLGILGTTPCSERCRSRNRSRPSMSG